MTTKKTLHSPYERPLDRTYVTGGGARHWCKEINNKIKNETNVRNTCKMLLVLEAKEPFFQKVLRAQANIKDIPAPGLIIYT